MKFAILFEAEDQDDAQAVLDNILYMTPHMPKMTLVGQPEETTMSDFNNGLSAAEAERLAIASEECGEVVQAIGKTLRHGHGSTHPEGGPDNRENLRRELLDVAATITILEAAGDIRPLSHEEVMAHVAKKLRYTHHQAGLKLG